MFKFIRQFIFLSLVVAFSFINSAQAQEYVWPGTSWVTATPEEMGMDPNKLNAAKTYAQTYGGSGMITRGGKLVMSWGSLSEKKDIKSSTKSFGATALGLAIQDGKLTLQTKGQSCHPSLGVPPESNKNTGWLDDITLFHLATQTAGFDKNGGYTALLFAPGTGWAYSDGGPNWLAECITLTYRQDLYTLMTNRVFNPIGIPASEIFWRNNAYRSTTIDGIANREFGAGISTSVNGLARLGYLYLRQGKWSSTQIIPSSFVDAARINQAGNLKIYNPTGYTNASKHYGLLWWNNADKSMANVPADAYWTWGLYESLTLVIPSLDIVVSRLGSSFPAPSSSNPYSSIEKFFEPIAQSVTGPVASPSTQPSPSASLKPSPSASLVPSPSASLKPSASLSPTPCPPGDSNCDGVVSASELKAIISGYLTPSPDLTGDTKVNSLDISLALRYF